MQLRLRDFFAKAFNKAKKTDTDVFSNTRSMAKLFKEAGRVKKVLSANTEHVAQVFFSLIFYACNSGYWILDLFSKKLNWLKYFF